ncbi:styrene monooxygenase/indole monooxygenase family protein [Actimicrobium antarcticum]|uniref:Styrene monooxygenase StyA putative substrate binding domain-containing protein n=1 Tax=Actimicrobium antarcticum TaxID=1051899 RepID=A0ABP7SXV3_9BURK
MRKITIIGAGQAGLQLGIGLLDKQYDVTIVSNRTGDDIGSGRVMSSQSMYDIALGYERELGLNFWDATCPSIDGVHMRAGGSEGKPMIDWTARMTVGGQSVDQRIKMPRWMKEFQKRGGKLEIRDAGIDDLERYAAISDLVIVSSGKGEVGKLFARDAERSEFDQPLRTIGLTYVHGMLPRKNYSALNISINPGIGEYINFPALTTSGTCDIINLECIAGGPMDRWSEVKTPEEHLAMTKWMIDTFFPWEAERCKDIRLTDDNGTLVGRIPPTVRKPLGTLPSGALVFGMADVLVLNDPITGQGSNNASKCARLYNDRILAHGRRAFDRDWMEETFERYWDYAQWVVRFTNTHLLPPPPQLLKVFSMCGANPALASFVANAFDDPKTLNPWYYDAAEADRFVARFQQAA